MSLVLSVCAAWFAFMAVLYFLICRFIFESRWGRNLPKLRLMSSARARTRKEMFRMMAVFGLFMSAVLWLTVHAARLVPNLLAHYSTALVFMVVWVLVLSARRSQGDGYRKYVTPLSFAGMAAGAFVSYVWTTHQNWLVSVACAIMIAAFMLSAFRDITARQCAALSAGMLLFDVKSVFVTKEMQELASHATGGGFIGMVPVPSGLSAASLPIFQIGMGDIFFPGLIIVLSYRMYGSKGAVGTVIGYVIGLATTVAALLFFNLMQPATLYLIPATFVAYWLVGLLSQPSAELSPA